MCNWLGVKVHHWSSRKLKPRKFYFKTSHGFSRKFPPPKNSRYTVHLILHTYTSYCTHTPHITHIHLILHTYTSYYTHTLHIAHIHLILHTYTSYYTHTPHIAHIHLILHTYTSYCTHTPHITHIYLRLHTYSRHQKKVPPFYPCYGRPFKKKGM